MKKQNILHLTLSKKPFEVMVTGEKDVEFRTPSDWIFSRLDNKEYDAVKFVNGYGKDKPYFIAKYKTWNLSPFDDYYTRFSNGLSVMVRKGDVKIFLGDIIETGNL